MGNRNGEGAREQRVPVNTLPFFFKLNGTVKTFETIHDFILVPVHPERYGMVIPENLLFFHDLSYHLFQMCTDRKFVHVLQGERDRDKDIRGKEDLLSGVFEGCLV